MKVVIWEMSRGIGKRYNKKGQCIKVTPEDPILLKFHLEFTHLEALRSPLIRDLTKVLHRIEDKILRDRNKRDKGRTHG